MMLTLAAFTTAIEAYIVKGRLEAEGIPALIIFEHHIWAKWSLSLALGGVRVQVPGTRVDQALKVLEAIDIGEYQSALLEQYPEQNTHSCPQCKAVAWLPEKQSWKLALIIAFLFYLPVPYTQYMMKCESCNKRWVASGQRQYPLRVLLLVLLLLYSTMMMVYGIWCYWCRVHCAYPLCQ